MMLELFLALSLDVAELASIPPKEQCTALLKAADDHWYEMQRLHAFDNDRFAGAMSWANHRWYLWNAAVQVWVARESGHNWNENHYAREHLRLLRRGGP